MNINLRRAAALQNAIQDAIRGIALQLNVKLNEFQDPSDILDQKATEVMVADSRRNDLLVSLYSIRASVSAANAQAGISDRLARAAYTDKRIEQLGAFSEAQDRESPEVIAGRLEKIRNRKDDSRSIYGREDEVYTGVLPKETLEQVKVIMRDMKKQKQRLNDEILELNVRTEITLGDDVIAILTRENLV